MTENKQDILADRGLDRFTQFLLNELDQVTNLTPQIPNDAFIFYGAYNDPELTKAEIEKATKFLIRLISKMEKEHPLRMIYEYAPAKFTVIDLASEERKRQVRKLLLSFHEQSIQTVQAEVDKLIAV